MWLAAEYMVESAGDEGCLLFFFARRLCDMNKNVFFCIFFWLLDDGWPYGYCRAHLYTTPLHPSVIP